MRGIFVQGAIKSTAGHRKQTPQTAASIWSPRLLATVKPRAGGATPETEGMNAEWGLRVVVCRLLNNDEGRRIAVRHGRHYDADIAQLLHTKSMYIAGHLPHTTVSHRAESPLR